MAVSHNSTLARSAGLAGAATLVSRVLGVVREQVLAAMFGAGNAMDAYIIAFRMPNLVRDLFAEGAMSAAFIPTFTRHLATHGKPDAWRVAANVMTAIGLATGTLVLLGMVFARPLVMLYAGDYSAVPGKLELATDLTRVMLPMLTLVALAAAVMGMLNSLNHFFVPALSPAMFNIATIAGAFLLVPLMPALGWPPIMAIGIAAIVGGIGQIAIQWPALAREGFRYRPFLDVRDPGLRSVLLLMGPGTIGLAATQVNLFVNTSLATSQGTGAASWLSYAFRLMYLPIGLFGVSVATAVLPVVSRHASVGDTRGVRETVSRGLSLMLALNIPATFGLIVLATPIVRVLFERGAFAPSDTLATAAALRWYSIGLIGYSAARITSPVFYALGRNRVPVAVSIASMAFNIAASLALVTAAGFRGLALGTSLAALVNSGLLLLLLRRPLQGIDGTHLASVFIKLIAASMLMAAAAFGVETALTRLAPEAGVLVQVWRLAAAIGAGLLILVASAKVLGIQEFSEAIELALGRVRKLLAGTT